MVTLMDEKIVTVFSNIFNIQPDRIIYGQLEVAKNFWIRYSSTKTGVAVHPYMAFFRTFDFHPNFVGMEQGNMLDVSGNGVNIRFMRILLRYTIEIIGDKIIDQNEYMKKYFLWVGNEGKISFDYGGVSYNFGITPEIPEDNSDLEAEEETGRVVRTTFNFAAESLLLDSETRADPVTEILSRIHLYSGNVNESALIDETSIT